MPVLLVVVLSACEHGVTLDVTVEIPGNVQELYSESAAGTVLFGFDMPKTGTYIYDLGALCESGSDTYAVTFTHDSYGCAKRATAYAWVEPASGSFRCGLFEPTRRSERTLAIPAGAPQGAVELFPDNDSRHGCASGRQVVTLRVTP